MTIAVTACGGPSAPGEPPPHSPLSARAESAPLPALGSSFEDRPTTDDERATTGHEGHAAHSGGEHAPPADAGAPDASATTGHERHGGHGHAH